MHNFTFHQGFVYLLQDVALHQCLPLSSVDFLFRVVPSFLAVSSFHLLRGGPLDLFPLLGCHSGQRLVHLLPFILAMCQGHFHFCFSVYSMSIDLGSYSHPKEYWGNGVRTNMNSKGKIPEAHKENRVRDAASHRTASSTHNRLSYSGPMP